jgi:hypothetical protein
MDILATLLKDVAPQLIEALTSQGGLDREQAERFVPEATEATLGQLRNAKDLGLDPRDLLEGRNVGSLLSQLDIGSLAGRVGMGESQVLQALQAFVPALLGILNAKGGGAEGALSLLGGGGAAGVMGAAGKLAGKLFGS